MIFVFLFQGEKRELDGKSFLGTILAKYIYIYIFITRFIVILTINHLRKIVKFYIKNE